MDSKMESREATIMIGWYTFILHFLTGFYFLDIYRGSSSDWVASPIFELSNGPMQSFSLILAIYSFLFMLIASCGLVRGVVSETRLYYFPWLIFTLLETVALFYGSFYLITRYNYDSDTLLVSVIVLLFAIYHGYLYSVVLSNYRYLKKIQSPTLIFPSEIA